MDETLHHITARRLREARESVGYTQKELAQKIGSSQGSIQKLEGMVSTPPAWDTIRRLSKELGYPIEYLLAMSDDIGLSNDERNLLALFKQCDGAGQNQLLAVAEELAVLNSRAAREAALAAEVAALAEKANDSELAGAILEKVREFVERDNQTNSR